MNRRTLLPTLLLLLPIAAPAPAAAQVPTAQAKESNITRAELEALLARYQGAQGSATAAGFERVVVQTEAALIRNRLENGDFQEGDRVALEVEEHPALTDTFVVRTGRVLALPMVGDVPLHGVLRSELQDHLREHVGRVIRDPVVRANSLVRLSVEGSVSRPGFYAVPSDVVLGDVLMVAGGPAREANLEKIRIERGYGGDAIWQGDALRQALGSGMTLDQLSLNSGDRVIVPDKNSFFAWQNLRWMLGGLVSTIFLVQRIF